MIRSARPVTALTAAALLMVLFFGCAPKQTSLPMSDPADAAWRLFREHYCSGTEGAGLKVKASLHYTREVPDRRSDRTRVTIWGNFEGPIRLNVSATLGKIVAMIREDKDGLLVFYPTEERAYAHTNPVLGATRLGMPFPFSLEELSRVVMGDFSGLVPTEYAEVGIRDGAFVYRLKDSLASEITLDNLGRPIHMQGVAMAEYSTTRLWHLDLERYANGSGSLADKLILSMDNGERGVLRIKSRELRVDGWAETSTELPLPDDTLFLRLDGRPAPTE